MAIRAIDVMPELHSYQKDGAMFLRDNPQAALLLDAGLGKAQPLDEPILTPSGWTEMGSLKVGDQVIGSDGLPTDVTAVFDRGEHEIFEVLFRDGSSTRVSADHLWQVRYSAPGGPFTAVRDTKSIMPLSNIQSLSIPTAPLQMPEADLPMDPYMLGGLIADGYLSGNGITWTKNDLNVVQEMREAVEFSGYGFNERKLPEGFALRWGISGVVATLRGLGLLVASAQKFIPGEYFQGSIDQRTRLIHGLFDGDGSVRKGRGTARYATTSFRLSEDVLHLLWSIGVGATKTLVKHHRGHYWYVQVHGDFNPFLKSSNRDLVTGTKRTLRRSFKSITPLGTAPVRCIKVSAPDSLYMTKDYILTHNTATVLRALTPEHLPALVVAPPRVAANSWPEETAKWRPDLRLSLASGSPKSREAAFAREADIYAVSQDVLHTVPTQGFKTLIIDELSGYKTRTSRRHKCAVEISKNVEHVWGMTGTPSPNGLLDLWGQYKILDGGKRLYPNIGKFRSVYFTPGRRLPNGVVIDYNIKKGAAELIHDRVSDISFSIDPATVLDLPDVLINDISVELPRSARKVYKELQEEMYTEIEGKEIVSLDPAATSGKLAQIAAGVIYDEDRVATKLHEEKIKAAREIVDGTGSPVIIWYGFLAELELLKKEFPEGKDVRTKEAVKDFTENKIPVLFAHPLSAGKGLNLHNGGAHVAIWCTLPYSSEDYVQANARLARKGQPNKVIIHRLLAKDTVDDQVKIHTLAGKIRVQDALLNHVRGVR